MANSEGTHPAPYDYGTSTELCLHFRVCIDTDGLAVNTKSMWLVIVHGANKLQITNSNFRTQLELQTMQVDDFLRVNFFTIGHHRHDSPILHGSPGNPDCLGLACVDEDANAEELKPLSVDAHERGGALPVTADGQCTSPGRGIPRRRTHRQG